MRSSQPGPLVHADEAPGRLQLWNVFFWGRHAAVALLGLIALIVPVPISHRLIVGAGLLGGVLPFGILMHAVTMRRGRAPLAGFLLDALLPAAFTLVSPSVWPASLVGALGLACAVSVGRGRPAGLLVSALEAVTLAPLSVRWPSAAASVGILTFLVSAPLLVTVLGTLVDIERESRLRFTALLDELEAVVWEADPATLRFSLVSRKAEKLLGYTAAEWTSDPNFWVEHLHPADRDKAVRECRSAVAAGRSHDLEYRMVHRSGRAVWVHDAVQVEVQDGAPVRLRGVMVDVTALKEAAEAQRRSESRYRELFDNASDGVYTLDLEGRILSVNRRICQILGYSEEELVGKSVDLITAPEFRAASRAMAERKLSGDDSTTYELDSLTSDGRRIPIEVSSRLVYEDGEPVAVQGIARDIRPRRAAEEALRDSERRYARAFEREREAAERLRLVDDMKNTFLEAVSHELRTPLTSVMGFADTLARRYEVISAEQRTEFLRRLSANAHRLEQLLTELLDLDRLNRGIVRADRRETDVAQLAVRVCESYALPEGWRLEVDAPPMKGFVDAPKVERILENLLANAVRHTPRGTTVWVRLERRPRGVVLSVEDDGPGVPDDLRQPIFEPFTQGDAGRVARPGVGIGLTLVARFAEIHAGRAWVEDRPGGGAAFRVFLPDAGDADTTNDGGPGPGTTTIQV